EVPAEGRAETLLARHAEARVEPDLDGVELGGLDEAGPPRARAELRIRAEQLGSAPCPAINAGLLCVGVGGREGPFRRLLPQHGVLLGAQALTPLRVGQLDPARHLHSSEERRVGEEWRSPWSA